MEFQILGLNILFKMMLIILSQSLLELSPPPFTNELKNLVRVFENWPGDEDATFSNFMFWHVLHCWNCYRRVKSSAEGVCEDCEEEESEEESEEHELETP